MDAKEEGRIQNRLTKTREELTNFIFWLLSQHEREKVMNDLKYIQSLINYHRYSNEATDLLKIIEDHIAEVGAFEPSSRVVLLLKQSNIPAESIGEVILTTAVVAEVKFDHDPKPATINKYLFRLETQETSESTVSVESVESEEPLGSGKDLDAVSTTVPASESDESQTNPLNAGVGGGDDGTDFLNRLSGQPEKKKRGPKKGTTYKKRTGVVVVETSASIQLHKSKETVVIDVPVESSEVKPQEDVAVSDASVVPTALLVMDYVESLERVEETFLIRDLHAFEQPYFLFVKKEYGGRQIYVVTQADIADKKRISFVCSKLGFEHTTWVEVKQFMHFEPPTIFTKEEDKFFYLTFQEYQMVYTTQCLVDLPMRIPSIETVLNVNALFQDRIVDLLRQYALQNHGFSVKNEVLAIFARLAKHNLLDLGNFITIVQMVFEDDPVELENVYQQFTEYLGHDAAASPSIQSILSTSAEKVRRRERIHQMKTTMHNLTDQLQDLPDEQLQLLQERLNDVKKTS